MFVFFQSTVPLLISLILSTFVYLKYEGIKESKKFIYFFCSLWTIFFLLQYYILGPYSPIQYHDNADIALSRILYEKNFHLGGSFLHSVMGRLRFLFFPSFWWPKNIFRKVYIYYFSSMDRFACS